MNDFTLESLLRAVDKAALLRLDVRLQPASADGYVAPPTYAPISKGKGPHVEFRRGWVDGQLRDTVVLDSPQSQSNRIEHALLHARRHGSLPYPDIEITMPGLPAEPVYSVLQLSHRIFDATLRACTLNDTSFIDTDIAKSIYAARPENATAMFIHAPITLVLGGWDSHGGGGPLVAKLPRVLTSEIVGLDAQPATRSATKVDPMDIRRMAALLVRLDGDPRRFDLAPGAEGGGKKSTASPKVYPSELGFGSVPASGADPVAATISEARQTSVISFTGLRALRFPDAQGQTSSQRDGAARAVLAALGLYGLLAQSEAGYLLRSRCELVPVDMKAQLVGGAAEPIGITATSARALLGESLAEAQRQGLSWRTEVLRLEADSRLQVLVRNSRAMSVRGEDDDDASA
jgi:CRISPR-associated protein Csb1